tara:strand:+ start:8578 stop:10020 length:1443 start_codon:yes stop_codon:yes gene_type:complete
MLFNSIEFLLFLPIIFTLYWFVFNKNIKLQNLIIFLGSYLFYGWWDYRFLSMIFLSTVVDYFIGVMIFNNSIERKRKILLICSILFNLGVLGFFKYYNFFVKSWIDLFSLIGYEIKSIWTLNIILPVGISFYTFQTMSYTIDIYRRKLQPTRDFVSFASFVSFFPQLVAGPIERATNLLPQILNRRKFKYEQATQGLNLILFGMFKKVVIADSIGPIVDDIFTNYETYGGLTLWIGAIYFSFQIYCDFSGYSDIAIGTAKLFGIELMQNFKTPYFSRNIGEFWRRWHISLSTWFRDYLYIPLGGSKEGKIKAIRNIFIIFTVSGFWHGANWNFIVWGLFHSILFIPFFLFNTNRKYLTSVIAERSYFPSTKETIEVTYTYILIVISWVLFRSENLTSSFFYLKKMFFDFELNFQPSGIKYIVFIFILLLIEYLQRKSKIFENIFNENKYLNKLTKWLILLLTIKYFLQNLGMNQFIYFQF